MVRNLKCKDFLLTLPGFATKNSSLTMLVLTFIRFVAHCFFGAYFLLSFYCHLPLIRLCARNTSKTIVVVSGDSSFLWLLGLDINSVKKTVKKAIK